MLKKWHERFSIGASKVQSRPLRDPLTRVARLALYDLGAPVRHIFERADRKPCLLQRMISLGRGRLRWLDMSVVEYPEALP